MGQMFSHLPFYFTKRYMREQFKSLVCRSALNRGWLLQLCKKSLRLLLITAFETQPDHSWFTVTVLVNSHSFFCIQLMFKHHSFQFHPIPSCHLIIIALILTLCYDISTHKSSHSKHDVCFLWRRHHVIDIFKFYLPLYASYKVYW